MCIEYIEMITFVYQESKNTGKEEKLFRMLDNRQLVHPVHERMTFLNDTFKFTVDAGDQLISGKQVSRDSPASALARRR